MNLPLSLPSSKLPKVGRTSSTSRSQQKQRIFTVPPSPTRNVRANHSSSPDSDCSEALKEQRSIQSILPRFRALIDLVSQFQEKNSTTSFFEQHISDAASEVNHCFPSFYKKLSRSCGSPISTTARKSCSESSPPTLRSAAVPFIRAWSTFSAELDAVRSDGEKMIRESIKSHFSSANSILELFTTTKSYDDGVHDKLPDTVSSFRRSLDDIEANVSYFLTSSRSEAAMDRIISLIKAYSQNLVTSLSTTLNEPSLDLEKVRLSTVRTCSELISEVRAYHCFHEDIATIEAAFDELDSQFKLISDNLNLTYIYEQTSLAESKEVKKQSTERICVIDQSIPLSELIDIGEAHFSRIKDEKDYSEDFFATIRGKVAKLQETIEIQKKAIEEKERLIAMGANVSQRLRESELRCEDLISQKEKMAKLIKERAGEKNVSTEDEVRKYRDVLTRATLLIREKAKEAPLQVIETDAEKLIKMFEENLRRLLGGSL